MPTPWEQKRAAIAAALAGGNSPSVGASPMVNPMISAMSPQAPGIAGGSPGLMGAAPTQGQMMAQANASLQGAPGFNYVPPAVGPPPVAAPAAGAANPNLMTPEKFRQMIAGEVNADYQTRRQMGIGFGDGGGRGGGYSTSGRGGSGSSSSARGGGFRGF